MAISRIGAVAAASTSLTPTAGLAGDVMVAFAYRSSAATVPTLPAGWTTIASGSGNTTAGLLAYHFCTGTSDTATGFTGATQLVVTKYRGVLGIGAVASSNATGTSIAYPALSSMVQTGGKSWVYGVAGHRTATNVSTVAPTGMTAISGANTGGSSIVGGFDTNAGVASWSLNSTTVNASSGHESFTVELLGANSTLDPYAKNTNLTLSGSNLIATAGAGATNNLNIRGTLGRTGGKYMWGGTITNGDSNGGLVNLSFSITTDAAIDQTANGLDFWSDGTDMHYETNNVGVVCGSGQGWPTPTTNLQFWYAVDIPNNLVWFKVAGGLWNGDATANPDTGVGGKSFAVTGVLYPFIGTFLNADVGTFDPTGAGSGLTTFNTWDGVPPFTYQELVQDNQPFPIRNEMLAAS